MLSVRDDAETWWRSADRTIFQILRRDEYPEYGGWLDFVHELLEARIGRPWDDRRAAMAAYERHNDDVRANAPHERLLEWNPREGWEPICTALGLPVPDGSFPHVNSTVEWEERRREEAEEAEEAEVQ